MAKKYKITFNAPFTLTFVLLCFVATLLGVLTGGSATRDFFMTSHTSLANPMTYVRFFTHALGHADWSHFVGNATYLLLLGPLLEEKYSSRRLLFISAATALITALINYFFFPNIALCGASGVVFAFILLASFTGFRSGEIPLTFILVAVIYIGGQIYEGIAYVDNISNTSHILGGAVGSIFGFKSVKKTE